MAVEKDITVEPVGDFALKGIRRPLTAYNVLASKAANLRSATRAHVRYWHKADIALVHRTCPLLGVKRT